MSLRVVHGSGGGAERSGRARRTSLHIVPLQGSPPADHGGAGRHRLTTFAVTVDDLIVRECASPHNRASMWVMALAVRRGLLPGCSSARGPGYVPGTED